MKEQKIHSVDLIWLVLAVLVVYILLDWQQLLHHLQVFLFGPILAGWTISLSGRILHRQARFILVFCGCLLLIWYSLRYIKYDLVNDGNMDRYIWYLYYLPILFIPCALLRICLLIGQPETYQLPRSTYFLYAPAVLLFLLVLSNDLHQLVFSFPKGFPFAELVYHREIGYFLCFGWIALCSLLALITMALRTGVPMLHRVVWVPWIPVGLMLAYGMVYIFWSSCLVRPFKDMTWVFCVLSMMLMESCLRTGLIPANMYHLRLFGTSPFPALITNPACSHKVSTSIPLELDPQAVSLICQEGMVRQGTLRLHGSCIEDGYVVWQEDVQEVQSLLDQLKQANAALAEENDLLEAENSLRQRQIQSAEKHRLYDLLIGRIYPCLEEMELLVKKTDRDSFIRLVFLGTYAKRRSNLFLLAQEHAFCSCKELAFCLQESAESLQAAGIDCSVRCQTTGEISCVQAARLYDAFQEIVSSVLSGLQILYVSVIMEETIRMTILADGDIPLGSPSFSIPGWSVSMEDGTAAYRLVMERQSP